LYSAANGKINKNSVYYDGGSAVCVIAASNGYPDKFEKGFEIFGLDKNYGNDIIIYHSGTKIFENKIVTNGGRVLGVTAISSTNDLMKCKKKAYEVLSQVDFRGIYYRKDIADKALK
ncbi:MAG: phosphoribosylamine--glycine ligase, partial [Ignavibacteriales bacterium]|nr:phosphoribosylamine--glycine ligase [Ignavibacteriales bacterium]